MIRTLTLTLASMLVAAGIATAGPHPASMAVRLDPQHGSKISGKATITHVSEHPLVADVVIVLDGAFIPENQYPAGIYVGSCARMSADPVYRLKPVIGGRSKTRVAEGTPPPGPYVLAVFDTAAKQVLWCGALSHEGGND
jgi:hypothetical protein